MQGQTHRAAANTAKSKAHSIRMTESLWVSAKRRATEEGLAMNYVVTELMEGYARGLVDLPKMIAGSNAERVPGHSVRATDELWKTASKRAKQEGITMNDVVSAILDGYARGLMDTPKVTKSFGATKKTG